MVGRNLSYRISLFVFLIAALPALLMTAGCSHKKANPDDGVYAAASGDGAGFAGADGASSDLGNAFGLQTVHFAFDSDLLDESSKSQIQANVQILTKNPGVHIQVEGHCDKRGGIQYNIALGERRANAVKHFMEDSGISSERITTISYGKEKPVDPAETEEAYAKNRRANFVVTKSNK